MKKLQPSNLPSHSVGWGREVEQEIETTQGSIENLRSQLEIANSTVGAQADQITSLQNQIRTICELAGYSYPPVAAPPPPPVIPDPAPVRTMIDIPAQWSATWYQSFKRTSPGGTNDDSQSLYQRGSGYTYSMWRFDVGAAAGKNIVAASMFLSNISTYYNGPFTAILGTHGYSAEPGSRPAGGRINGFDVGWQAGKADWINLEPWTYGGLSNGSIQGFTMGDLTRETQNFARFNGVGRAGAPVLRLLFDV